MFVQEKESYCPYCGEVISLLIDNSIENQKYTEDCEVCCRPILIEVKIDFDGDIFINTKREND